MIAQMLCPFAQHVEGAAQIDIHHRVIGGIIHVCQWFGHHDTGIIDNDVNTAKFGDGFVKQGRDRIRAGNIGLDCDGLVAPGFQGFGQFLCRPGRVGIIDDNGKTIGRQTFGKGNANAARGTR